MADFDVLDMELEEDDPNTDQLFADVLDNWDDDEEEEIGEHMNEKSGGNYTSLYWPSIPDELQINEAEYGEGDKSDNDAEANICMNRSHTCFKNEQAKIYSDTLVKEYKQISSLKSRSISQAKIGSSGGFTNMHEAKPQESMSPVFRGNLMCETASVQMDKLNSKLQTWIQNNIKKTNNIVERFAVPSNTIGLVIGKAGENMKKIIKESGASIQLVVNDTTEKIFNIMGDPTQIYNAKVLIGKFAKMTDGYIPKPDNQLHTLEEWKNMNTCWFFNFQIMQCEKSASDCKKLHQCCVCWDASHGRMTCPVNIHYRQPKQKVACSDLFVTGLSPIMTDNQLFDYFKAFGKISHAHVIKDDFTGQSKGTARVKFFELIAENSVLTHQHVVNGHQWTVKISAKDRLGLNPKSTSPDNLQLQKKQDTGICSTVDNNQHLVSPPYKYPSQILGGLTYGSYTGVDYSNYNQIAMGQPIQSNPQDVIVPQLSHMGNAPPYQDVTIGPNMTANSYQISQDNNYVLNQTYTSHTTALPPVANSDPSTVASIEDAKNIIEMVRKDAKNIIEKAQLKRVENLLKILDEQSKNKAPRISRKRVKRGCRRRSRSRPHSHGRSYSRSHSGSRSRSKNEAPIISRNSVKRSNRRRSRSRSHSHGRRYSRSCSRSRSRSRSKSSRHLELSQSEKKGSVFSRLGVHNSNRLVDETNETQKRSVKDRLGFYKDYKTKDDSSEMIRLSNVYDSKSKSAKDSFDKEKLSDKGDLVHEKKASVFFRLGHQNSDQSVTDYAVSEKISKNRLGLNTKSITAKDLQQTSFQNPVVGVISTVGDNQYLGPSTSSYSTQLPGGLTYGSNKRFDFNNQFIKALSIKSSPQDVSVPQFSHMGYALPSQGIAIGPNINDKSYQMTQGISYGLNQTYVSHTTALPPSTTGAISITTLEKEKARLKNIENILKKLDENSKKTVQRGNSRSDSSHSVNSYGRSKSRSKSRNIERSFRRGSRSRSHSRSRHRNRSHSRDPKSYRSRRQSRSRDRERKDYRKGRRNRSKSRSLSQSKRNRHRSRSGSGSKGYRNRGRSVPRGSKKQSRSKSHDRKYMI